VCGPDNCHGLHCPWAMPGEQRNLKISPRKKITVARGSIPTLRLSSTTSVPGNDLIWESNRSEEEFRTFRTGSSKPQADTRQPCLTSSAYGTGATRPHAQALPAHNVAAAAGGTCLCVHRLKRIVGMEGGKARSVVSLGPVSATVLIDDVGIRNVCMYDSTGARLYKQCQALVGSLRLPHSVVFGGLQRTFMARFS
jgi:hypothetical protein